MIVILSLYIIFCALFYWLGLNETNTEGVWVALFFVIANILDAHSTILALKHNTNNLLEEGAWVTKKTIEKLGITTGSMIIKFGTLLTTPLIWLIPPTHVPFLALSSTIFFVALNNYWLYFQYCRHQQEET